MLRAVEIGLNLPIMVPGLRRDDLLEWSRRIDAGPYSTLASGERITFPNPEILVTLSAAAAVTSRVKIQFSVLVLPTHDAVRVAKQNENGMKVAQFLESHPKIRCVYYPGLPSHPDHDLATRQMEGFGGVVSFEPEADLEKLEVQAEAAGQAYDAAEDALQQAQAAADQAAAQLRTADEAVSDAQGRIAGF